MLTSAIAITLVVIALIVGLWAIDRKLDQPVYWADLDENEDTK